VKLQRSICVLALLVGCRSERDVRRTESAPASAPKVEAISTELGVQLLLEAQKRFLEDGEPRIGSSDVSQIVSEGDAIRAIPSTPRFGARNVSVRLPRSFDGALEVEASGMSIRANPLGLAKSNVEWAQRVAVYPSVAEGTHAFRRVVGEGVEDLFSVDAPSDDLAFSYGVALRNVAGLRLVDGTLELLDAGGAPRLRVPAPVAWDASGVARRGRIEVSGCKYDVDPNGPWGRPVTKPGADSCVVTARIDVRGLSRPVLFDPAWLATGATVSTHAWHSLLKLPAGTSKDKVLLVGGGGTSPSSTELFDPSTSTWAASSTIGGTFAIGASAVVLSDGTAIIAGGLATSTTSSSQSAVYRRNPTTGVWTAAASMSNARTYFSMHPITSGGKEVVLAAGGQAQRTLSKTADALTAAETYDPSSDTWSAIDSMGSAHTHAGSTLLADGRVMVVGGDIFDITFFDEIAVNAVDIYDGSTAKWTSAGTLAVKRSYSAVVPLGGAKALVAGGLNDSTYAQDSLEYYDGTSWTKLTAKMSLAREHFTGTRLSDGRVLLAGGNTDTLGFSPKITPNADLFDPGTDPKTGTIGSVALMAVPRQNHAAVALGTTGVLVAGGSISAKTASESSSSEIFDASIGGKCGTGGVCPSGLTCVDGVCCSKSSCPEGERCNAPGREGICTKAKGASCTSGSECETGFCVSGACCESACTGGCRVCNDPTKPGSCVLAKEGTDPEGYCFSLYGSICAPRCSASGSCSSPVPAGTPCGASISDAGTPYCKRWTCGDWGSCVSAPFDCDLSCTSSVSCDEDARTCAPTASGVKPGYCVIDGKCWAEGDLDPKDPLKCRHCDPFYGPLKWTATTTCIEAGVVDTGPKDSAVEDADEDTSIGDAPPEDDAGPDGTRLPADPGEAGDASTCGCRTPGQTSSTSVLPLVAGIALAFLRARRRK